MYFPRKTSSKKEKLGETSGSRPPVPLTDSPSKSLPPCRFVNLKQIASSLPQTTHIYTQYENPPSTIKPSNTPTSNPTSSPLEKFNHSTTTLPVSIAEMLNKTTSPSSSTPSSPPYYVLSSDSEPSDPPIPYTSLTSEATTPPPEQQNPPPSEQPQTPPSEQPQIPPPEQPANTPSEQPTTPPSEKVIIPTSPTPADTAQTPPTSPSPNPEPEPAFPTLEEAITLFVESLVEKIKSLSVNSGINDDPSAVRIH
ncbi:vegetative cell wall protein gp1-like [Lathyrus oleraceus]|uniref:vegetative cell wall protein gp1-like n=1 Tax=Pisum sativum TaxID=3888 RepID=UPI0021D2CDBD|nr:vegetative cell wall protein gp1-like [Pisum sativum]